VEANEGKTEGVVRNARERVRAAVSADIVAEARRQLALEGAAALSLRAVARQLGMASSAMYRYFPSRDELLTALIVEGYEALGEVAEQAATAGGGPARRFRTVCRAIRRWALDHPHEYALLYGSPIPGYQAPGLTVGPASRATLVLTGIVLDAYRAEELTVAEDPPLSRAMAAETRPIGQLTMPDVPLPVVARALVVWTLLFGQISFELFGRFEGIAQDTEVLFEHAVSVMTVLLGMSPRSGPRPGSPGGGAVRA
jgi:AcrR family transcriptional regulator